MKKLNKKLSVAALGIALMTTASWAQEESLSASTLDFLNAFNQVEAASEDLAGQQEVTSLSYSALSDEEADNSEEERKEAKLLKAQQEEAKEKANKTSQSSTESWSYLESFFAPVTNFFTKLWSIFIRVA